jgi:glycosyltransferase involved in cell wall biosynthesis
MRIGFLINTCEPFYRGGYERRTWSFARELARLEHDVRIYTSCPRDEVIEGVRFIRLGPTRNFFNQRGVRNGWADLLFALDVLKLLWKLKPGELEVMDVCATPFLHLPLMALVGRMRQVPCVLTCHEALLASLPAYARERGHESPMMGGLITRLLAEIYRFGVGLFPRRIAVSHHTAAALEEEGYPAKAVVELGLEREAFNPLPPTALPVGTPIRFIFCGRLTPIKSVENTISALSSLKANYRPFHFDLIGEGSEMTELKRRVALAHMMEVVAFHGEVSEERKQVLLSRAEIFILSSPREGFSIATLEAMAQGCAAVVISDPEQPNGALDFVRDGIEGIVVPLPGLCFFEALEGLQQDAAHRLTLRQAAWKKAQEYKIESQGVKLLNVYRLHK